MIQESDPIAFAEWIGPALLFFLESAAILGFAAVLVGFLVAAYRSGFLAGGDVTYRMLRTGLRDLVSISPRRIGALAWLAIQESLRRRVLVGFGLFLLILLFAGWFLDTKSNDPATLYLSFVLTMTTYLVLLMALFLSAFSLPTDFKTHTIYTIVTKPVRCGEIVLGRVIGFTVIGTLMLAIMGVASYVFVTRMLNHTHEVEVASLTAGPKEGQRLGRTTAAQNHRHNVTIDADGHVSTDIVQGHFHEGEAVTSGDKTTYTLSGPRDLFTARVPAYGTLRFKDRSGKGGERGISVGKESKYRSFIEGGTLAAAIWEFDNVTPDRYPNNLPVELTIRVFRSHKGNIERGIEGSLVLRNPPGTGRTSPLPGFTAKDLYIDQRYVPRKLIDPSGKPLDLFDDLVDDGKLEIILQCVDNEQYFGVAQHDLYLRTRDASFTLNFIKCYIDIWAQMLLVTSFGVMFSTFLSGIVACLGAASALVLSMFKRFVFDVADSAARSNLPYGQGMERVEMPGGGPVEAFIRMVNQQNVTTQMEPGLTTDVVHAVDRVFTSIMSAITSLLPNFEQFRSVDYLTHGFDVPPDLILVQSVSTLGYVVAMCAIGYFFLRTREVAR